MGNDGGVAPLPVSGVVVVAGSAACCTVVGGLPLGVRAVLALRAAGFTEIGVVAGTQRASIAAWLERRGVGDTVRWLSTDAAEPPMTSPGPLLMVAGDVLFEAGALIPLLTAARPDRILGARAATSPAGDIRAAICPPAAVPAVVAALDGGRRTLAEGLEVLDVPAPLPHLLTEGLFLPLDVGHPPSALARALLAHLGRRTTRTDGYLARLLDRHLSRRITQELLGWPVTPNQITLASILVGLVGAAGLASLSYAGRLGGVLVLLVSSVLDGVDGELARARFEQSAAGARLDVAGDYVINLVTFAALGIGLARQGLSLVGLWAAAALVGGVATAMATAHALFIRPALRGGDPQARGDARTLRGTPVATVVERVAGRDYLYLLLLSALVGHLEWFLYAAAVGSWGFVVGLFACWAHAHTRGAWARS